MTELLKNYVSGHWIAGNGPSVLLTDPVTGAELIRVSRDGIDREQYQSVVDGIDALAALPLSF